MHVDINADSNFFVPGMKHCQCCHFQANTGKSHQIFQGPGNIAIIIPITDFGDFDHTSRLSLGKANKADQTSNNGRVCLRKN
jgi:hypothetical protein